MRNDSDRQARATHIHMARGAIHHAHRAFHDGDYQAARHGYMAAVGWFGQAGAVHLARRAEAIGRKVLALQEVSGLPVGAARRRPVTRGRIVRFG